MHYAADMPDAQGAYLPIKFRVAKYRRQPPWRNVCMKIVGDLGDARRFFAAVAKFPQCVPDVKRWRREQDFVATGKIRHDVMATAPNVAPPFQRKGENRLPFEDGPWISRISMFEFFAESVCRALDSGHSLKFSLPGLQANCECAIGKRSTGEQFSLSQSGKPTDQSQVTMCWQSV